MEEIPVLFEKGGETVFDVTVRARASEIRRVWTEIDQKREEIFEEEEAYFDGQSMEWLQDFWEGMQKSLLKRSRRMVVPRMVQSGAYTILRILVVLAIALMIAVFAAGAFADLNEFLKIASKIAWLFFKIGFYACAVSAGAYFGERMIGGTLKYQIAVQQILAENYSLVSQYSEDVNSFVVLILASKGFSFKKADEVRKQEGAGELNDELFVVRTNEELDKADKVQEASLADEDKPHYDESSDDESTE